MSSDEDNHSGREQDQSEDEYFLSIVKKSGSSSSSRSKNSKNKESSKKRGRPSKSNSKSKSKKYSDDEEDEFDDEFVFENDMLYLRNDPNDRKYVDSLGEVARLELYEDRLEKRNRLKKQRERERKQNPSVQHKSSKSTLDFDEEEEAEDEEEEEDEEEDDRSSKKRRSSQKDALSDIQNRRQASSKPTRSSRRYDSSEDEDDRRFAASPRAASPETFKPSFDDMRRIFIRRAHLEKWCSEPYFEETVVGCFCRVLIGEDNGKRVYRLCEITGLGPKNKTEYTFGKGKTMIRLNLKFGKATKAFRMDVISDSEFLQTEYSSWCRAIEASDLPYPSREDLENIEKKKTATRKFTYDEKTLKQKLENQTEKLTFSSPDLLLQEKIALKTKISEITDDLKENKSLSEVQREKLTSDLEEHKHRLEKVERKLQEFKDKVQTTSSEDIVAIINERNREKNRLATTDKNKKQQVKSTEKLDPFARRSTVSKFFAFPTEASPMSAGTNKDASATAVPVVLPPPSLEELPQEKESSIHSAYKQIDLDEDVPLPSKPISENAHTTATAPVTTANTNVKKISLSDYKKMRK